MTSRIRSPKVHLRDLAEIIVGGLVLAFPVAVTEEVWNLSVELPLGRAILISMRFTIYHRGLCPDQLQALLDRLEPEGTRDQGAHGVRRDHRGRGDGSVRGEPAPPAHRHRRGHQTDHHRRLPGELRRHRRRQLRRLTKSASTAHPEGRAYRSKDGRASHP